MAALEYVYTLGKRKFAFPERCTSQNAISTEFLEVQIPLCVLLYDWAHRCPVSSTRSAQKFGGKNKKKSKNRTLETSIKNFKGFRKVRKSIETSSDISVL